MEMDKNSSDDINKLLQLWTGLLTACQDMGDAEVTKISEFMLSLCVLLKRQRDEILFAIEMKTELPLRIKKELGNVTKMVKEIKHGTYEHAQSIEQLKSKFKSLMDGLSAQNADYDAGFYLESEQLLRLLNDSELHLNHIVASTELLEENLGYFSCPVTEFIYQYEEQTKQTARRIDELILQIPNMLVSLQFQDQVSQCLQHVKENIELVCDQIFNNFNQSVYSQSIYNAKNKLYCSYSVKHEKHIHQKYYPEDKDNNNDLDDVSFF